MDDYNKIAAEFEAYGKEATTDIEIGYKNVLKLLGPLQGKKVLDYGCGTGKFTRTLKDLGADAVGVDIGVNLIRLSQENNPSVPFYLADEMPKDMTGNFFDAAVLNFVISAISSEEMIIGIFRKIHAALRAGGILVLLNTNYEKSGGRTFLTFKVGEVQAVQGFPIKTTLGVRQQLEVTDFYYSNDTYTQLLKKADFNIEHAIEPKAENTDYPWKDELAYPPFIIISAVAQK